MKKKSLSVIGKIFTSVILTCYSFAPSVMAIDELISIDNSQDILETGISDPTWITSGNSSTTFNVVTTGETYVAPQNSEVMVTFSKLPTNPSTLSITEITLTDAEVEATGAVSNKAYDINTDMVDGTFEYDLTLPSSSNDTKVIYAENRNDLLNNVQEVNNAIVDQGDTVKIENLNHFTIYIVTTTGNTPTVSSGTVNNQSSVTVRSGQSVTVKLNVGIDSGDTWKSTRYQIDNGSKICINTPDHTTTGSYNESFTLNAPSSDGTYDLNLRAYTDSGCSGDKDSYSMNNAIVVDNSITPPTLIDNPLDKYAMSSVTGIWTSITGGSGYSGINTNEIRWGTPSGSTKSGLKFTNSGSQSFNEGSTFYLGMLTHMNWGTYSGTAATGATLQITLDFDRPDIANQVLTYNFAIEETSNGDIYFCPTYQISDTPCDDKVTFPNSYGTQVFTIDDVQYTLVIDGFVSEYPSGATLSAFITEEQKDNSAFLVGHLSSVLVERPAISIIKKTNNQDITAAPGNNLYIGDTVTWQYIVQNTGNTTLTNITVADNPSETITCPNTSLTSGTSMTCTASGTVINGSFVNTATVTGRYTGGTVTATDKSYYNGALYCGDNVKNGAEECDGNDGLPNSEFQCTNKCKLELTESKVTVCHASVSQSNPYVTNQPDKSADVAGHDGHNGPIWYPGITTSWGDIIPPFSYIGGHYDGKNWTAEGQAIWDNGCSIPHGTLIVQKTTLPSLDNTIFNITASGTGTIFNGGAGTISDTQDYTYTVAPGTYSVIESVPSGWGQTSNACANITIAKGETKYCSIENKRLPVLTINKVLNGESVSLDTFSFVLDGWRTINFELDGSNELYVIPNTMYTIAETDPGSTYDVAYSTDCTGALDYNETATCTITNTEYASLTILKQASPDSTQAFGFTTSGTGLSNFSLTDDGSVFGSNTRTFLSLLPGTYSVTETPVSGWDSEALCDDGSLNTAINISAGETVTCTFTNVMRGAIGGHKYNDADGDYLTNDDRTGVAGWTIELYKDNIKIGETTTALDGAFGFGNLVPGAYQLRESLSVGGWYKIYPTADYLDVTLLPGENDFANDFVNVEYPTITVLKNVDTDADGTVDITGATDWTWDVNGIGDNLTGSTVSVNPGTYTISEDQKANYHVTNLTCNGTDYGTVESQSITLTSGQDLVCTFTNTRDTGTLRVVKIVTNDNGGTLNEEDFSFVVDSDAPISFEADGSNDLTKYAGGITYSITEPTVAGYATTYDNCTNVTVPANGVATCTITNDDVAPTLTLVKTVKNDNGGTKAVSDFPLFIDSTAVVSEAVTSLQANIEYTVSETNSFGYEASVWGSDCSSDGKITLLPGDTKTCTITNDDIAPTLRLEKLVTNDNGGANNPEDWTLYAQGATLGFNDLGNSTTFHTVEAGITYNLLESATPTGYTPSWWSCTDGEASGNTVKLGVGENVTCTISNDDIAPTLRLVKTVTNNNGGTAVSGDWDLTASGSTLGFSDKGDSIEYHTVKAGIEYTLSESSIFGYSAGDWSCTNGTLFENKLTLLAGEDAICTINNDDIQPTLTVIKTVINDNGGYASSEDFTMTVTGTNVSDSEFNGDSEGTVIGLDAGTYVIDEYDYFGYTKTIGDTCTGTISIGEELTCTITNDDQPGSITVYKDIVDSDYIGEGVYADTEFNVTLNGDLTNIKTISDTEVDPQIALFDNLNAGSYSVDELTSDGFTSLGCYPVNRETLYRTLLSLEELDSLYVENGENIEVVCTNQVILPELQLAKANNSGGVNLVAGSNVLYTLVITAPESQEDGGDYIIEDVKVVDLPPAGIKYQPGSWTAVSNIRGDLKALDITTEPTYASPGKWNLGEMIEGEVVTLTYIGNISSTLDAGKYKDLAWTEGVSLTDNRTLGKATTGFFASTNVNIAEPVEEGEVLGITDEQRLPDTGANTFVTIGAAISMILGLLLLIFNPKKKMIKALSLSVIAAIGITSFALPTKAYAESGDLAVEIEQPQTPYSDSTFKVGFVALDIQSRDITIQCYETTHGAFGPEYTLNTVGNSGDCAVDNTVITTDGTYEFYVVAKAGTDEVTSEKVSVTIDLVGPSPVVNYEKTKVSCVNNLQFTTANDGQTTKTQIFRSNVATFTADSSTLIKEIIAGPNQPITYSDTLPICDATYFYAVRALDVAGNTSSFVTDKTVIVTILPVTPTTPVTPVVTPTEEVKGTETTDNSTDNTNTVDTTNPDTDEEIKGATDEENQSNVWSWLKYVLIGIGAVAIISISYMYAKGRNRGETIK